MRRRVFLASAASVCALSACAPGSTRAVPAAGAPGSFTLLPASPFPAETRRWTGGTVPDGWMLCNGQTLAIATYPAVYQALGTGSATGDGTTFRLPSFRLQRVIALRGRGWV